MFTTASKRGNDWVLGNRWGHETRLPALPPDASGVLAVATLGTRMTMPTGSWKKTDSMVGMLQRLDRPLLILDTRRTGCGAMGAWGPETFATTIPLALGDRHPYTFVHCPSMAPTTALLAAERRGEIQGWRVFRDRYDASLQPQAVAVALAFAENASLLGGLAVLLCAEAWCAGFEHLAPEAQDAGYCHRFRLATRMAQLLRRDHPGMAVQRLNLDPAGYAAAAHRHEDWKPIAVAI